MIYFKRDQLVLLIRVQVFRLMRDLGLVLYAVILRHKKANFSNNKKGPIQMKQICVRNLNKLLFAFAFCSTTSEIVIAA